MFYINQHNNGIDGTVLTQHHFIVLQDPRNWHNGQCEGAGAPFNDGERIECYGDGHFSWERTTRKWFQKYKRGAYPFVQESLLNVQPRVISIDARIC